VRTLLEVLLEHDRAELVAPDGHRNTPVVTDALAPAARTASREPSVMAVHVRA
jgi:hypothetical protein